MPKSFGDTESQILFLMMVCKMRGLSYKDIQEEIRTKIHVDMSIPTIMRKIEKMQEGQVKEFNDLKKSNDAYISNVVELKNHLEYYRRLILQTLYGKEFVMYQNPRMIYKAIEMLYKIDETEWNMLKTMPDLFAWGGIKNQRGGGGSSIYGDLDQSKAEKSIEQFVISMNQIDVPYDIEKLQKETEDKNLGAFQQTSKLEATKEKK